MQDIELKAIDRDTNRRSNNIWKVKECQQVISTGAQWHNLNENMLSPLNTY